MRISENFDRWMFDYKEGNLSAAEEQEFENFLLQHPEFEVDADAWDMAYVPNEPVIYPHAEKLEKKRRVAGWYYWSAAALLLLLIGSTTLFMFSSDDEMETLLQSDNANSILPISTANVNTTSSRSDLLFADLIGNDHATNSSVNYLSHSIGNSTVSQNLLTSPFGTQNANQTGSDETENDRIAGLTQTDLVTMESGKLAGSNHVAQYSGNPVSKDLSFDISKKSNLKSGSNFKALRKVYHKIERMLGYPVGLTNLRDPDLLIPQSNLLSFNSAFTGGMLKPRFEMNYRNQWLGSDQNSSEMNLSYDNYSYAVRGGVGLMINAQDYGYGQFGDYNVSLLYSPKLVLGRNIVVEPSVKLTMGTLVGNGDKLMPDSGFEMDRGRILNTIDENHMNGVTNQWYKDYGLGMMINTKWFYAGFSSDNLGRHYENVYGNELSSPSKTPVKLTGVIGFDYVSNTKTMTYSPFVAYRQYGNQPELWAGMNYRFGWMTLGGAISSDKEFTASAGIKFDTFKLIYHYDYTASALTQTRMGSHNIGIRINAKRKNQRLTH